MTNQEVEQILQNRAFPEETRTATLLETHGSWILLTDWYAYKIKKPVEYSFMDFSTLEKRHYYCLREVELNQRLTDNIYLGVDPIIQVHNQLCIGAPGQTGQVIDYAVRMRRLDTSKQMPILLAENRVFESDMIKIARQLADFHRHATIIYAPLNIEQIREDFFDLEIVLPAIRQLLGENYGDQLQGAIHPVHDFLNSHKEAFQSRIDRGYIRDGHGDLHAGNIFLLDEPVLFDCLEFNDHFRQLDVLDEIAFLCMDLEFHQQPDLADTLLRRYLHHFPCMENEDDRNLFQYFKAYRANVRLKVSVLQSLQHPEASPPLSDWKQYISLISGYL
jgi:aminoglycoside phosphotransferase family enzyme